MFFPRSFSPFQNPSLMLFKSQRDKNRVLGLTHVSSPLIRTKSHANPNLKVDSNQAQALRTPSSACFPPQYPLSTSLPHKWTVPCRGSSSCASPSLSFSLSFLTLFLFLRNYPYLASPSCFLPLREIYLHRLSLLSLFLLPSPSLYSLMKPSRTLSLSPNLPLQPPTHNLQA